MHFSPGKRKKILLFSILVLASAIVCGLGIKYLPIRKLLHIRSASESDFPTVQIRSGTAPHSLLFDFEVAPGKTPPDGLYKGIAHSGIYSVKAFGKNSYSTAIERKAEEIVVENLKSVGWSAWVYVFPNDREVKASFVFAASNDLGVNVCWKGIGLSGPGIPRGKWFKISGYSDISEIKFKPGYRVQIYFWNDSSTDILVDDYYVVFNGAQERRGDSALIDMTKNVAFKEEFNRPPFHTRFLRKNETGNGDSPFLCFDKQTREGKINPGDRVIAGNFTGSSSGTDDILVVTAENRAEIFTFCAGDNKFRKLTIEKNSITDVFNELKGLWKGKFIRDGMEQLLIKREKEWILGKFEQMKEPCDQSGVTPMKFNVLWRTSGTEQETTPLTGSTTILTGDFDGDQLTELLATGQNGSWQIFRLGTGPSAGIRQVASGVWSDCRDKNECEFTVSSGRFLSRLNQDLVLTVYKGNADNKTAYSLIRFNLSNSMFEPLFPSSKGNHGITVGFDSLHLSDRFLTGNFEGGNRNVVLRYDRSWRFDLKQIQFNDTTFEIRYNLDFSGYRKDHNPKYYESVELIPGHFLNRGTMSLLVIGRNQNEMNGKSRGKGVTANTVLPAFISVYSLDPDLKK